MRLPWTLWLSMSIELWRLVLLTTAVLVTVIAFALAIKPLAAGQLGPTEAIRFMLVAMPPMLSYALPFASCFGATLAYHRMVHDREVVAAHAAGLSHLALLGPAIGSGLVLAVLLSVLNAQIIPRFVRSMQEMVADDLARAIVNRVESGQAVERRDIILSARTARVLDPSEMPGARSRLWLTGVVALFLDEDRMPRQELFADSAQVWILPGSRDAEVGEVPGRVVIQVGRARGFDHAGNALYWESRTESFPLPNAFRDDPAFLTTEELARLDREPERMNYIDWRRIDLAYHLASREVLRRIAEDLREGGSVRLEREGETVVARAAGLRGREGDEYWLRPLASAQGVEVDVRGEEPSGAPRLDTFSAERAILRLDLGDDWRTRDLSLDLTLRSFAPTDLASPLFDERTAPIRTETEWTGLRLPGSPERELLGLGCAEVLDRAHRWLAVMPAGGTDPELASTTEALERRIRELRREVAGTRHARVAMAVSCLAMIVGGAIASLRLRTAQALVIYCWAFFPAIATVITISTGREMVHRSGLEWLVVVWGGVGIVGLLGLLGFRSVSRH